LNFYISPRDAGVRFESWACLLLQLAVPGAISMCYCCCQTANIAYGHYNSSFV